MSQPIEIVIDTLNDAFARDNEAMESLMKQRVACNAKLADHPTVQAGETVEGFDVGPLGLLNGVVERLCAGARVAATYGDDGKLQGFTLYRQAS